MKKIKSLLIMVMTVLLTFGLVSCGKDNKNNNKNTEYSITFMVDGAVYDTIQTAGNEKLTFPDNPTKEDYTFDGWYTDIDVWEEEITENSFSNTPLTENITLYARFIEKVKYTITFMVDDDVYGTIKTAGNKKLQFPQAPTKENYAFWGWYLDKDVWEKEVTEDTYLKAPLTENITLYARFTVPTIIFIVDDEIYETIETFGNEKLTFPEHPTKGNYTFVGWYFDNNNWENELTESTYVDKSLTSNVSVYAKFEKIPLDSEFKFISDKFDEDGTPIVEVNLYETVKLKIEPNYDNVFFSVVPTNPQNLIYFNLNSYSGEIKVLSEEFQPQEIEASVFINGTKILVAYVIVKLKVE